MKTKQYLSLLCATLLLAGPAVAQDDEEASLREAEQKEAEFAERMREAEKRLEEAAARVAELSAERIGSMRDGYAYAFAFDDERPRLGVTIGEDEKGEPVEGVLVIGVSPGSAAAEAGIRAGDTITSVNGQSLSAESAHTANRKLLDFMKGVEEGDTLDVEYLRSGNVGKVAVKPRRVENRSFAWMPKLDGNGMVPPAPEVIERFRHRFGGWRGVWADMELVELTEGLGRYFGTDSGLLVISAPKSNLFTLEEGDVIRQIDGREPSSVNHCMRILGSYEPGEKIVLDIMRDKKARTIEVEVPDNRSGRVLPRAPQPLRPVIAPRPVAPPAGPVERT